MRGNELEFLGHQTVKKKVISLDLWALLQWMQPTLEQNYLENTCARAIHICIFDLFATSPKQYKTITIQHSPCVHS